MVSAACAAGGVVHLNERPAALLRGRRRRRRTARSVALAATLVGLLAFRTGRRTAGVGPGVAAAGGATLLETLEQAILLLRRKLREQADQPLTTIATGIASGTGTAPGTGGTGAGTTRAGAGAWPAFGPPAAALVEALTDIRVFALLGGL